MPGYVTHFNEAASRVTASWQAFWHKGSYIHERKNQSVLNDKKVKWINLMINQARFQQLFIQASARNTKDWFQKNRVKLTFFFSNNSRDKTDIFVLAEATQTLHAASYQSKRWRKTRIYQILSIQVVQGSEAAVFSPPCQTQCQNWEAGK